MQNTCEAIERLDVANNSHLMVPNFRGFHDGWIRKLFTFFSPSTPTPHSHPSSTTPLPHPPATTPNILSWFLAVERWTCETIRAAAPEGRGNTIVSLIKNYMNKSEKRIEDGPEDSSCSHLSEQLCKWWQNSVCMSFGNNVKQEEAIERVREDREDESESVSAALQLDQIGRQAFQFLTQSIDSFL